MIREVPPKFPGAVRALELWLKADGSEAETEEEATSIVRTEFAIDDSTVFKVILRPTRV